MCRFNLDLKIILSRYNHKNSLLKQNENYQERMRNIETKFNLLSDQVKLLQEDIGEEMKDQAISKKARKIVNL